MGRNTFCRSRPVILVRISCTAGSVNWGFAWSDGAGEKDILLNDLKIHRQINKDTGNKLNYLSYFYCSNDFYKSNRQKKLTRYVSKVLYHYMPNQVKPFSDPWCSIDGDIVILEDTTPMKMEMFHHRTKVINQTYLGLICSGSSCKGYYYKGSSFLLRQEFI